MVYKQTNMHSYVNGKKSLLEMQKYGVQFVAIVFPTMFFAILLT
jgi:hypothetical protein